MPAEAFQRFAKLLAGARHIAVLTGEGRHAGPFACRHHALSTFSSGSCSTPPRPLARNAACWLRRAWRSRPVRRGRRAPRPAGAGVSAESGVPTFRQAGGLWRKYDPAMLATPQAFSRWGACRQAARGLCARAGRGLLLGGRAGSAARESRVSFLGRGIIVGRFRLVRAESDCLCMDCVHCIGGYAGLKDQQTITLRVLPHPAADACLTHTHAPQRPRDSVGGALRQAARPPGRQAAPRARAAAAQPRRLPAWLDCSKHDVPSPVSRMHRLNRRTSGTC
jgi:hypothetical protein